MEEQNISVKSSPSWNCSAGCDEQNIKTVFTSGSYRKYINNLMRGDSDTDITEGIRYDKTKAEILSSNLQKKNAVSTISVKVNSDQVLSNRKKSYTFCINPLYKKQKLLYCNSINIYKCIVVEIKGLYMGNNELSLAENRCSEYSSLCEDDIPGKTVHLSLIHI